VAALGDDARDLVMVGHSRGCHVLVFWLQMHPARWRNISRMAFLHPDVPRSEVLTKSLDTNVAITLSSKCPPDDVLVTVANRLRSTLGLSFESVSFSEQLKAKVAVFDTESDFATTSAASSGGFAALVSSKPPAGASRHIGDLCALHESAPGASHTAWLDEPARCQCVVRWLLSGSLGGDANHGADAHDTPRSAASAFPAGVEGGAGLDPARPSTLAMILYRLTPSVYL
jgi:hypothetical protein